MGNKQEVPDLYQKGRYAWENIFSRTRFSRRSLLRGIAVGLAIPAAALLDSAAQKFEVKPQDTIPMQTPIWLAREVKQSLGKLVERVS